MNKFLLLLASAMTFSAAHAQVSSSMNYKTDDASKGFRLAILKPVLEMKLDVSVNSDAVQSTGSDSEKVDNSIGFGLGYANLPVSQIGYTGQLSYLSSDMKINDNNYDFNILRAEGNVAWAFTSNLYMKGGLNFADIVSGSDNADKVDGRLGYQVGLGFQVTKTFGIDLTYTVMNFNEKVPFELAGTEYTGEVDYKVNGLELGLTATF